MADNELKFEEKMNKLSSIVEVMDKENLPLEEMLSKYEEALKLIDDLSKTIKEAKEKVNK